MTLERGACAYYTNLPPSSIEEFDQLLQAFTQQFLTSKSTKKIMTSQLSIEQKHCKPLGDFLKQLSESRLQIKNCSHDMMLVTLVNSVCHTHSCSSQANASQSLWLDSLNMWISISLRRSLKQFLRFATPLTEK